MRMDIRKASGYYLELRTLLESLSEAYVTLLTIAQEKQAALVAAEDHDRLRAITAREEAQADAAVRLEKERLAVVAKIAELYGVDKEGLTVSGIAALAGEPLGGMLRGDASKLLNCLNKVREQNSMNRQLLEMKISYNAFMMDAFSYRQEGPTNLYGANGQEDASIGEIHRILDSEV